MDSTENFYQIPDIKVNFMIDSFISDLKSAGHNASNKIFVAGFSVWGMWADRYTLLHPNRVKAYAAGAPGGALTLPESHYHYTRMDWSVGINDFFLTGANFNVNEYKNIPHFIYIGD